MTRVLPLAALVVALGIVLVLLAACQSDRSGQQPSCMFACVLTAKEPPPQPPAAQPLGQDEEIIIPPNRRSIVIRRFAR